jgi:hypothetical protein
VERNQCCRAAGDQPRRDCEDGPSSYLVPAFIVDIIMVHACAAEVLRARANRATPGQQSALARARGYDVTEKDFLPIKNKKFPFYSAARDKNYFNRGQPSWGDRDVHPVMKYHMRNDVQKVVDRRGRRILEMDEPWEKRKEQQQPDPGNEERKRKVKRRTKTNSSVSSSNCSSSNSTPTASSSNSSEASSSNSERCGSSVIECWQLYDKKTQFKLEQFYYN